MKKGKNIFTDAPDCATSTDGALAGLFRKIMIEDKIVLRLPQWIQEYADRTEETSNGKSKCKHNMTTHIKNKIMTIKSFINIFQNVIKAKRVDFNVTIYYSNGKITNHGETLNLSDDDYDEDITNETKTEGMNDAK